MAESLFVRIKRVVEQEKDKKVRGEARLASLQEEEARILKLVTEEIGKDVTSLEEVEKICDKLKQDIETDISDMVKVLKEEGIEV